ncbi:MAG: ribonuclease D [Rickettsiales bacterium]|nr:ribonuclease D [Rickettsiales bacterium]
MANYVHKGDLPEKVLANLKGDIAVDTEAMGLNNMRDRLCVVQLSDGRGDAHLVHFDRGNYHCPNLSSLLTDSNYTKIFHFARFDVAIIKHYLGITVEPVFCTKIASKLTRTYTDSHGLKDLCRELLEIQVSKQQQSSDWGADTLSQDQIDYAASDVLYLHQLRDKLEIMLKREERYDIALECFKFMKHRADLDLMGWINKDIFSHAS